MIPKIIHYCWFGGNPFSPLIVKCMESWKKYCPDYAIKEWNESNFNINLNAYTKQAYEHKMWAFVSDVARLYVMYNYGGVYLDTDVEIIKPIDEFLNHHAFSGFESENFIQTGIMACRKNYELIQELLSYYDNKNFINNDGSFNTTPNTVIITDIMSNYGLAKNNQLQTIRNFTLYPTEYFCPKHNSKMTITENTYAIHHFNSSWWESARQERKKRKFISVWGYKIGIKLYYVMYYIRTAGYIIREGIRGVFRKIKFLINKY